MCHCFPPVALEILLRERSKSVRLSSLFGCRRKKAAMPRNASAKPVVKPGIQFPFGLPLTTPGNTQQSRLWQFSLFVS